MDHSTRVLISTLEKTVNCLLNAIKTGKQDWGKEANEFLFLIFKKSGDTINEIKFAFTIDQVKFKVLNVSSKDTINSVLKAYKVHLKSDIVPHLYFVFPKK